MDARPFIDPGPLVMWLAAVAVVVIGPGWLLVARHVRRVDPLSRLYLAMAAGLLVAPLWAWALAAAGVRFAPATYLVTIVPLGLLTGLSRRWRESVDTLTGGIEPLEWRESLGLCALCVGMGAIVLAGFRDYAAPNHIDDASNHAFMVWRVLATGSVRPDLVFGAPWGSPPAPYLVGWHASAALAAGLAGVPAWIGAWYLPALACAVMPIPLTLLWRAGRLPLPVVLLGGAFAVANYHTPVNIFSWGGFGAIIGLLLAPWIVLALRAAVIRPGAVPAVLAGLTLVAIIHIHTSELFTALALLFAYWPGDDARGTGARVPLRTLLITAAIFLAVGVLPLLAAVRTYGGWTAAETLPPGVTLLPAASQFLTFAGGNVPELHWFVAPALVAGLVWRPGRRLALLALAFAVLYFGVRVWRDPVSLALSQPYYRHFARLVYPQMFLLPPLMAAAVLGLLRPAVRVLPGWAGRPAVLAALVVLVHYVLYPGAYWSYRNLEHQRHGVPFSAHDAAFSREVAGLLPGSAIVANQYGDGSVWAMHVGGLRFLDPCSWPLGERDGKSHRAAVARLQERPWPDGVRALRDTGVEWVYVADRVQEGVTPHLTRACLDADPRFAKLRDNGNAAVYRILWDGGP